MGKCTAYLYEHDNYRGKASKGFSKTFDNVETNGWGRNWATSYKLTGDCDSTVISMCRHDQWHSKGEQCRYMQGKENNLNHRRKYNDNNWNDDVDSIVVEKVPRANANQLEYNLKTKYYTPAAPNDGYCGGCRLWPEVKDRNNHKNADRDDVWLTDENPGHKGVRPCPGGRGYFTSGKGIKCIYSKNDDGKSLRKLHTAIKRLSNDKRVDMYDDLKYKFCAVSENRNKNVGEGKCSAIGDAAKLSRSYCGVGTRIKTDDSCTKDIVGTKIYSDLANAYCKKNPQDEWCACYNTFEKVCDTNSGAAGCAKVKEEHDAILTSLPKDKLGEQARRELNNRKTCRANICAGSQKYIPANLPGCKLDISMCIQDVSIGGHAVDTGIDVECSIDKEGNVSKSNKEEKEGDSEDNNAVEDVVDFFTGGKKNKKDGSKGGGGLMVGGTAGASSSLSLMFFCLMLVLLIA